MTMETPANTLSISAYIHCSLCITQLPKGQSPGSWAQLEIGFTPSGGIQVWCKRHDCNVMHLNLGTGEINKTRATQP